jgi:hypothetical protein
VTAPLSEVLGLQAAEHKRTREELDHKKKQDRIDNLNKLLATLKPDHPRRE